MKQRYDLVPEDIPNDTTIFIIIDGKVFELETCEEQELFGMLGE
jgi:hypothetical protein